MCIWCVPGLPPLGLMLSVGSHTFDVQNLDSVPNLDLIPNLANVYLVCPGSGCGIQILNLGAGIMWVAVSSGRTVLEPCETTSGRDLGCRRFLMR